jgi:hypothetical protein
MPRTGKTPRWIDDVPDEIWLTVGLLLAIAAIALTVAMLDFGELSRFLPVRSP